MDTQLVVYLATAACVMACSIALLFKTMGSGYGAIIASLQERVTQLDKGHRECLDHHQRCEERVTRLETEIAAVRTRINGKQDKHP